MIKSLLNKKYILYGASIIFTRGLEYLVLFFAAAHLVKEDYGELEYYKKIIEVGSSVFAFGFPALILSYTKSKESKVYFYVLSILFVSFLSLISIPFLGYFNWLFLLVPFIFYALFFNGGITPAYLLVSKGSNYASFYKIVISVLFYSGVFISIYFFNIKGYAYVEINYYLFPAAFLYLLISVLKQKIVLIKLKRYWKLFRKLLASSFTLVISNFANLMFLYTDIFIIKLISDRANEDIANFSFALNVTNMLLLIPLTLVQVDIEKLKQTPSYLKVLNKKIIALVGLASLFLLAFYWSIIQTVFLEYQETWTLFLLLLIAKVFHSLSSLYGTNLLIHKRFKENLIVNIIMLAVNIVLCYLLYFQLGINGVAIASGISLFVRYIILIRLNNKI